MNIDEIPTPALILDLEILERNIDRMQLRCRELGSQLRPHVKTHKCIEIARRQSSVDSPGITVSTTHEAEVFAEHGFEDITWAFPIIPSRIPEIQQLSERVDAFRVVIDSEEALELLQKTDTSVHVWLQIDCGYGRVGLPPDSQQTAELAGRVANADSLNFDGILTHSGQGYDARGAEDLKAVAEQERRVMAGCAEWLRDKGIPVAGVSIGSTPATSHVENLEGITEVRPGNYVFYDYTQTVIGSCALEDCALTVLTTVVSSSDTRGHSIVDAGALSLSKDPGPRDADPPTMGEVFANYEANQLASDTRAVKLSQEHGTINNALPIGTRLRILENHSCLTAACFDRYYVVRGSDVVGRWNIHRGRS